MPLARRSSTIIIISANFVGSKQVMLEILNLVSTAVITWMEWSLHQTR